jgi:uncharacterized protein (DUF1330 family)
MTVYIVAAFTIHDRSQYDKYESGFSEVFAKLMARCSVLTKSQWCYRVIGRLLGR